MTDGTVIQGSLAIVAAPSGAGKTSLVKALIASLPGLVVSLSTTTRPRRPGEVDGVDYHFVDTATFEAQVADGQFLEHARVFDHYYATSRASVQAQRDQGLDVILEIDWQGARVVREQLPECRSIYILPPSRQVLEQRLQKRGQDDEQQIARRMQDAVNEMIHYDEFDYIVVNDNFDQAVQELRSIFLSRRLESGTQSQRHRDLIRQLIS
jgi:guanylate kinase